MQDFCDRNIKSCQVVLTVFFEDPFWVGVFERLEKSKLSVCKVTFGAEPKDCEVFQYVINNYDNLNFSKIIRTESKHKADNPKRRIRIINKQLGATGISTKSQQALSAQREEFKNEKLVIGKLQREADKRRKFYLLQKKRKEKHRGR